MNRSCSAKRWILDAYAGCFAVEHGLDRYRDAFDITLELPLKHIERIELHLIPDPPDQPNPDPPPVLVKILGQ